MALFDSEVKFVGKHATYCRFLKDNGIFTTFREIYLISTIVGFLNGAKVPVDKSIDVQEASILPSELMKQKQNLVYLYRLIMLLEEDPNYTIDDYKNRAFKDDVDDEHPERVKLNMQIFNAYARGGLEIIYNIFNDCHDVSDYTEALYNYTFDFAEDCGIE